VNGLCSRVNAMQYKLLLVARALFAVPACGAAEVFTTTGPDGERVFTDRPPADAQKIQLKVPAASAKTTQQNAQPAFAELSACEQAKFILRKYENASSLAEKTEDGGTRILSAQEALEKIEQARADEKRLCEEDENE